MQRTNLFQIERASLRLQLCHSFSAAWYSNMVLLCTYVLFASISLPQLLLPFCYSVQIVFSHLRCVYSTVSSFPALVQNSQLFRQLQTFLAFCSASLLRLPKSLFSQKSGLSPTSLTCDFFPICSICCMIHKNIYSGVTIIISKTKHVLQLPSLSTILWLFYNSS